MDTLIYTGDGEAKMTIWRTGNYGDVTRTLYDVITRITCWVFMAN